MLERAASKRRASLICKANERVSGIEPPSQLWKSCIITFIRHPHFKSLFRTKNLFGVLGFEPRLNPPKGLVLPLHYTPFLTIKYIQLLSALLRKKAYSRLSYIIITFFMMQYFMAVCTNNNTLIHLFFNTLKAIMSIMKRS